MKKKKPNHNDATKNMKKSSGIPNIPSTSNGNKPKNAIHPCIIFTRPSKRVLKQM